MQHESKLPSGSSETLTIAEVAERMGISANVAYALAAKNELPVPVFKVGRQYRVSRRAYDALMAAQHDTQANAHLGA